MFWPSILRRGRARCRTSSRWRKPPPAAYNYGTAASARPPISPPPPSRSPPASACSTCPIAARAGGERPARRAHPDGAHRRADPAAAGQAGSLLALGVSGTRRLAAFPMCRPSRKPRCRLRCLAMVWLVAPAGTPAPVIDTLNAICRTTFRRRPWRRGSNRRPRMRCHRPPTASPLTCVGTRPLGRGRPRRQSQGRIALRWSSATGRGRSDSHRPASTRDPRREGEVVADDRHPLGGCHVVGAPTGGLGRGAIHVEHGMPARPLHEERGNAGHVALDERLAEPEVTRRTCGPACGRGVATAWMPGTISPRA